MHHNTCPTPSSFRRGHVDACSCACAFVTVHCCTQSPFVGLNADGDDMIAAGVWALGFMSGTIFDRAITCPLLRLRMSPYVHLRIKRYRKVVFLCAYG